MRGDEANRYNRLAKPTLYDAAVALLGATMSRLWLVDDDDAGNLTLGAAAGPARVPEGLRTLAIGEGLVGLAVARRAAVTMPDVQNDPRVIEVYLGR